MTTTSVRTAAVIAIGDELTTGQSLDTNSRRLSTVLLERGVTPIRHETLPDDEAVIAEAFRLAAQSADVIVSTGGLGPTADDLTRAALARALGEQLVTDDGAIADIAARFRSFGREMTDMQRVQALRPTSARCLRNDVGTAPGLVASLNRGDGTPVQVWCLPGPPRELTPIVERDLGPWIEEHSATRVELVKLHACGIGEGEAASRLGDLLDRDRSPVVGITASKGVVSLRIRAMTPRTGVVTPGHNVLAQTIAACRDRLGDFIFAEGETTLAETVLSQLRDERRTLAIVESCTGGMLGEMITEAPGASDVFVGGWITYSNALKHRLVGVPNSMLEQHGAVSRPVAEAMAIGGIEHSGADVSLAITGIAGPDGGSADKPVGTVWIANASRPSSSGPPETDVRCFRFTGDRSDVRERAALTALNMLRWRLQTAARAPNLLWQLPDA